MNASSVKRCLRWLLTAYRCNISQNTEATVGHGRRAGGTFGSSVDYNICSHRRQLSALRRS